MIDLEGNPKVQEMLGTAPASQTEKDKAEAIQKTLEKLRELVGKALGVPATVIPIFAVASLLTGNPIPIAALGIVGAMGTGYLVYDGYKLIQKQEKDLTPVEQERVKNPIETAIDIVKKPFSLGGSALMNLSSIADPDGKGLITRFVNFIEKRGEGDVPKEIKTLLSIYKTGIDAVTFPIKATVTLWGVAAAGIQLITTYRGSLQAEARDAAKSKEAEELKAIEDALRKSKDDGLEFERNLDLAFYEESSLELTESQQFIFKQKATDFIPVSNDKTIEEKNKNYRDILINDNLLGQFEIPLNEAENINYWSKNIDIRKGITETIRGLSGKNIKDNDPNKTAEYVIDTMDVNTSSKGLLDFYYFLSGNIDMLTPKQKDRLNQFFQQWYGVPFDQHSQNPHLVKFVDRLAREVLLMYRKISIDDKNSLEVQLTQQDELVEMVEMQIANPDFLPKYKDLWLAGAGVSVGGRDALQPQNTNDPVNYFRWITIPTVAEVDSEIQRNTGLRTQLQSQFAQTDFPIKMAHIVTLDEAETENALESICRMNPKENELFFRLTKEIITDPSLAQQIKLYFNTFFKTNPSSIDDTKLDQVINNNALKQEVRNLFKEMKSLKDNTKYFQTISNAVTEFLLQPTVVSPIMLVVETSPYFEAIYEYYGGNVTDFYVELQKYTLGTPNYKALQDRIIDKLTNNIYTLDQLKIIVGDPVQKAALRIARNDHFENVIRGNVLIEENLFGPEGRDHMKYLDTLSDELVTLGIIASKDEILLLIPDIDVQGKAPLTIAEVEQNTPIGTQLIRVTQEILNKFMNATDVVEKAKLLEISQLLNSIGAFGRLVGVNPNQIQVDYEPKVLLKYLNGVKVGGTDNEAIFAKHPYGYEI
ncbi:MAG: hypothetical protein ABI721_01770 [Candidatus Dojkabacteria bacterium]